MSVEHSKKVLVDLGKIMDDGKHHNIFHVLADLKELSEDTHGLLPELEHLSKEDGLQLAAAAYELIKSMIGVFASA